MRAPLAAGLPVGGSGRARRRAAACAAARRRPRRVPRHATAGSACSTSTARIGARRSRSAATRNAGCAASTTAGRSTSTATSSRCRRSRRRAVSREKVKHTAYPVARMGRLRLGLDGPGANRCPRSSRRRGRRRGNARFSIVKMHVGCNWAQMLEGAIDSAHSSSLHSTDMPPARVDGAQARRRRYGRGRRPTRRRGCRCSGRASASATRRSAARSRTPATHDYLRITLFVAPFTVLIPPNNRYNLSILNMPSRRHAHDVLLHRVERPRRRRHRPGGVAQILRRAASASTSTRNSAPCATATTTTCRTARR